MPALPDRLTHREAPEAVRQLSDALRSQAGGDASKPLLIDASALQHFDSSALAVLLECRRMAEATGRVVQVVDAPPKLAQLASLYGLDDVLRMDDLAVNQPVQG